MIKKYGSFVAGMAAMLLVASLVGSVFAASSRVEYNQAGISLFGEDNEVEAAIKTKLLESGVEFKTRIGVVTACHTGPTALGVALMPKFDHI